MNNKNILNVAIHAARAAGKLIAEMEAADFGSQDTSNDVDGLMYHGFAGDALLSSALVDADGSLLAVGCVEGAVDRFVVIRHKPSGEIEADFGRKSLS